MKFHRYLPTSGDSRDVTPGRGWPRHARVLAQRPDVVKRPETGVGQTARVVEPDG